MTLRKNIVITGASSGLGEGMARQFAAKERNLALCARRTDRLNALADDLRRKHPEITIIPRQLDVNDHEQVFTVFEGLRMEFDGGTIDRVVINAGIGAAEIPIGRGGFAENKRIIDTNLVAALAQAEAAMNIFRDQRHGHLVVVSSFAALRGMPGNVTAYAASKAGVAALADGIRAEMQGTPITVTTLLPGFIRSEMTEDIPDSPLMTGAVRGARALVKAIEAERGKAVVPAWPWVPMTVVMRLAPASLLKKFS
jgi:short-subunit dehydrogenase